MPYPGREFDIRHPSDVSVQTLRGHFVATTLIRAYWSPSFTTGQRYVYSASADAAIYIYGRLLARNCVAQISDIHITIMQIEPILPPSNSL